MRCRVIIRTVFVLTVLIGDIYEPNNYKLPGNICFRGPIVPAFMGSASVKMSRERMRENVLETHTTMHALHS